MSSGEWSVLLCKVLHGLTLSDSLLTFWNLWESGRVGSIRFGNLFAAKLGLFLFFRQEDILNKLPVLQALFKLIFALHFLELFFLLSLKLLLFYFLNPGVFLVFGDRVGL